MQAGLPVDGSKDHVTLLLQRILERGQQVGFVFYD